MQEPSKEELSILSPAIETVTIVNSSETLLAAVKRGDRHIQLQAHLNLTNVGGVHSVNSGFGEMPWTVQSIQVRHLNICRHSTIYAPHPKREVATGIVYHRQRHASSIMARTHADVYGPIATSLMVAIYSVASHQDCLGVQSASTLGRKHAVSIIRILLVRRWG